MTKILVKGIATVLGITFAAAMVYYYGWFEGHHGVSFWDWYKGKLDELEDETQSKKISE